MVFFFEADLVTALVALRVDLLVFGFVWGLAFAGVFFLVEVDLFLVVTFLEEDLVAIFFLEEDLVVRVFLATFLADLETDLFFTADFFLEAERVTALVTLLLFLVERVAFLGAVFTALAADLFGVFDLVFFTYLAGVLDLVRFATVFLGAALVEALFFG